MPGVLAIKSYPPDAKDEISKVAKWLKGPEAKYSRSQKPAHCTNSKQLVKVSRNLLRKFTEAMSMVPRETVVAAIRFEGFFELPTEKGWQVDLIPIHEAEEVTIDGQTLDSDQYARLGNGAKVKVSGNFFGLLFQYRFGMEGDQSLRVRMSSFSKRILGE